MAGVTARDIRIAEVHDCFTIAEVVATEDLGFFAPGEGFKAAEDGVVAYSGNELKGYGNLVLIRHSNGYVTAYAHASELMVKRGDTIRRGQVIAFDERGLLLSRE